MVEKYEVQQKPVDWKQIDDFIKKIKEITEAVTDQNPENDLRAKQEWAELAKEFSNKNFNEAFKDYLDKDPNKKNEFISSLKVSIQKMVEKFEKDNQWLPEDINSLLKIFKDMLGIDLRSEIKSNITTQSESISLGGEQRYLVMKNSSDIATKAWLTWATFYSAELGTSTAGNDSERLSVSENGWEKEYIVKLNNNPDNFYKVKVDKEWNLCPLAEEISNKLVNKKWEAIKSQVLLSNNESCKKYLANKLPDEIKGNCVIWWDSRLNDYTLTSYGRTLTIEPMTIAWDWISKDLSRNLAFLNLTNYIRNFWDQYGKIDPDINKKLKIKWIKVDKQDFLIRKENLWLEKAQDEEISRFKKYNNHEQWEDNWDKKKNNTDYRKIIFPTLQAKPASSAASWGLESWVAWWPKPENNPTWESGRAWESGVSETWRSEVSTWKPESPAETWKLVEISPDLRWMSDFDFKAIQELLGDKIFIEKKDGKISYNLEKTKDYLWTMRDKNWSEFKTNVAYISAIQILLNSSNEWDKIKIDWKFNDKTKSRVKVFQENFNNNLPKWSVKLGVDGYPWKDTLAVLLDNKFGDTVLEWQWHFDENWKIVFDNGIEIKIDNKNGRKYFEKEENWETKRYYEYRKGMNWLWYKSKINEDHYWFLYVWEFKDGNYDWKWTITWANWDKYDWEWENNNREWYWIYNYANWNKYEWDWKNNNREWHWIFTWKSWDKYEWDCKNNNKEWRWIYTWKSWDKYDWEWKNDNMNWKWTFTIHSEGDKVYNVEAVNDILKIVGPEDDKNIGKYIDRKNGSEIVGESVGG